jgi:pyruvate dehydrogenase E2 component (dihydrolipoamide acetyltransferase)
METGTIAKWLKGEGESVAAGDVICQVETDKAVVDFEAQDDLFIARILKPEGSADVKVGEPIFVSVLDADDVAAFSSFSIEASGAAPSAPVAAPVAAPTPAAAAAPAAVAAPTTTSSSDRVFASPLAKKIARESGVLLAAINGSGPHGRVVKADVEDAIARGTASSSAAQQAAPVAAAPAKAPTPQPTATHDYVDYPISADAQAYAHQLTQQKLEVPHFHLTVDLTVDKLLAARERLNAGLADDAKLSVNDFLIRAASLAMKKVPEVNSAWMGTFIRQFHDTNVNVVVSTAAGGSVAPVIPAVNQKGLVEISESIRAIVAKANDQTLSSEDLAAGTFTVSNVGMYDVRSLAGIVSPNQSCFLGFGTIEKKVVPNDGTLFCLCMIVLCGRVSS